MLRKIIWIAVFAMCLFAGCKKDEPEPVKTVAEYEAQARDEIDESNMDAELEKLEKEIAAEE